MRLDQYLVENNYFQTRNKAQINIKNKAIKVNGKIIDKPSYNVLDTDTIEIIEDNTLKYVSRGGLKLECAINTFNLDFKDKVVLDIGSSTGGFTDCALSHGARLVYAVDVGTNQLADKLREDKRVESYENTNILDLINFNEIIDIILLDCSFVSISNLIKAITYYLNDNNYLVLLIKPQFELGNIYLKNGIVKDKKLHLKVLNKIEEVLNKSNLYINKITKSKVLGTDGNQEFLAIISNKATKKIDFSTII